MTFECFERSRSGAEPRNTICFFFQRTYIGLRKFKTIAETQDVISKFIDFIYAGQFSYIIRARDLRDSLVTVKRARSYNVYTYVCMYIK